MTPEKFIQWLEERIKEVETAREKVNLNEAPGLYIGKGAQLTAFKQVLDYYRKHAVTHKFQ